VLKEKKSNKIALVFGREDSGLSNGELQQCNFHVQIPTSEEYTSLNLASAVMVVCYELRKAWLAMEGEVSGDDELWDIERATGEQLEHFYEHLERVLIAIEFHDPDNPRQLMSRLRRLFGRVRMDAMEMNIMRGILSNIEYHIKSSD
jgi:tRNA (cytidine32/uridine32-2'-O)-methyltransferase